MSTEVGKDTVPAAPPAAPAAPAAPAHEAKPAPEPKAPAPEKLETPLAPEVKPLEKREEPQADKKPEDKAPEKYELKLPDGSQLSKSRVTEIEAYAKEKGLTNEAAQAILERESGAVADYVKAQVDAHKQGGEEWNKRVGSYTEALQADKEIGGDLLKENVAHAHRVIEKFGTPELKDALNASGFGSYPELVRIFSRIGRAMGEDSFIKAPASGGEKKKSAAEVLYPSRKEE